MLSIFDDSVLYQGLGCIRVYSVANETKSLVLYFNSDKSRLREFSCNTTATN